MTVLLAVWGSSPGVGKSTLSDSLTSWLQQAGQTVDHFKEEEVLTRPEFGAVAGEFATSGLVETSTLLACAAQFVESALAHGYDVVVADALMPFVPTLLAMGLSDFQIDDFVDRLDRTLAPLHPVLVYLDGDPAVGLARAAARGGSGWLDAYVHKLARYGVDPPVHDLDSAIGYLRHERAVTLRIAKRGPSKLALVNQASELAPVDVLHQVQEAVRPWIPAAKDPST